MILARTYRSKAYHDRKSYQENMHTSLLNIPLKDKTAPSEVHLDRHDLAHCQPTYGTTL